MQVQILEECPESRAKLIRDFLTETLGMVEGRDFAKVSNPYMDGVVEEAEFLYDVTIRCCDCQEEFTFTVGEQVFYRSKKLTQPKRCKCCAKAKRAQYPEKSS